MPGFFKNLQRMDNVSRSYRTHVAGGNTKASSEKRNKRLANRKFRRLSRMDLEKHGQLENFASRYFSMRQVSNPFSFDKDGKRFWFGLHVCRRERFLHENVHYYDGCPLTKREKHKVIGK